MANIITFELCAEDRARLDRLAAALEKASTAPAAPTPVKKEEPAPAAEPAKEEKPAKKELAPPAEPAKKEPTKEEPAHTLADVRALAQTMLVPGSNKRAQVKELVRIYAPKISDIPADKVEEVWQKLNALKGAEA